MKAIICADIHGNFQALQSLLKTKCAKTADKIFILGDLVCMGPEPNEVVELVRNNKDKIIAVMGNHDKWLSVEPPPSSKNCKPVKIKHHDYMRAMMEDSNLEFLSKLPYYYEFKCGKLKFYLTHYGWQGDFVEVVEHPSVEENKYNINKIFKNIDADFIIFGHNHDELQFEAGKQKYICVGTLGMNKYGTYLVLSYDEKNDECRLERKTLKIPNSKTIKLMRQMRYPRYNFYVGYLMGKNVSIYQDEKGESFYQRNKKISKPVTLIFNSKSENKLKK